MTIDPRLQQLLERLDSTGREIANDVVKIENKHGFKGRSRALDKDIADEIINLIKKRIPTPPKDGNR